MFTPEYLELTIGVSLYGTNTDTDTNDDNKNKNKVTISPNFGMYYICNLISDNKF